MPGVDEYERLWQERLVEPRTAAVRLIIVRRSAGRHALPPAVEVTPEGGVAGDRWAAGARPALDSQVTLMDVRVAELIAGDRAPIDGVGDNFLVDLSLDADALPAGTRLSIGSALLEVTPTPHTGCKKFRERFGVDALRWVNHAQHRERRMRGIHCRVVAPGRVALGDTIAIVRG